MSVSLSFRFFNGVCLSTDTLPTVEAGREADGTPVSTEVVIARKSSASLKEALLFLKALSVTPHSPPSHISFGRAKRHQQSRQPNSSQMRIEPASVKSLQKPSHSRLAIAKKSQLELTYGLCSTSLRPCFRAGLAHPFGTFSVAIALEKEV